MTRYYLTGSGTLTPSGSRPELPRTVADLFDLFLDVWCAETCAPRMRARWSEDDPTVGQCSVTAFLVKQLYGGKVYGVPLPDGNFHCYNAVGDSVFDLTCEQFHGEALLYDLSNEQSAEVHFAKEEKRLRFELLRRRLSGSLGGKK